MELLSTVLAVMLFYPDGNSNANTRGLITASGYTDSAVATHVLGGNDDDNISPLFCGHGGGGSIGRKGS